MSFEEEEEEILVGRGRGDGGGGGGEEEMEVEVEGEVVGEQVEEIILPQREKETRAAMLLNTNI